MTTEQLTVGASYRELFDAVAAQGPEWLRAQRAEAFESFASQGIPTPRIEEWRYTSLAPIADSTFRLPAARPVDEAAAAKHYYASVPGPRLAFVDGRFHAGLSDIGALPKGAVVQPLSQAIAAGDPVVEQRLGSIASNDKAPFTALAKAVAADGCFVRLAAGVVLEQPIQILQLSTGTEAAELHAGRNLMVFEANSQATIIETHASLGAGVVLSAVVDEILVGANAHIDHYFEQRLNRESFQVSGFNLRQDRDSTYRRHGFDFGGSIVRHDYRAKLEGRGCEATLNGLYLLSGRQHCDNWMWVEHCDEDIPSHEVYKGVLLDESSASFTGRIYVHPEAQRTDAKQTNQNLLLSDSAKVNTKPQLEIYADDVKCTHGATIGQLDEAGLFYLMARGVPRTRARNLLVHAFASDIVERVRVEPVRDRIEASITELLPLD